MWNTFFVSGRWRTAALFLSLSGCTALSDCKYEVGQKYRTSQAWHDFDGCNEQCFTCDYRDGWKKGYYDVLTGGDGRPPLVPPKKYWKPPVFTEHDPSGQNDWYTGYQDGASCGKSQPDFHYVPTFLPDSCPDGAEGIPSNPAYFPLEHSAQQSVEVETFPASPDDMAEGAAPVVPRAEASPSGQPVDPSPNGELKSMPPSDDYEKDPEPSSTALPPNPAPVNLVAKSAVSSSLLQQLVLNANQEAVTGATRDPR